MIMVTLNRHHSGIHASYSINKQVHTSNNSVQTYGNGLHTNDNCVQTNSNGIHTDNNHNQTTIIGIYRNDNEDYSTKLDKKTGEFGNDFSLKDVKPAMNSGLGLLLF